MTILNSRSAARTLLAAGALLAGCSESRTPSAPLPRITGPNFAVGDNVTATPGPVVGKVKICKVGNVSGTFSVTAVAVNGGTATTPPLNTITVAPGTCITVAEDVDAISTVGANITINETSAGLQSVSGQRIDNGVVSNQPFANGGALFLNNFHGYTLTFTNNVVVAPAEGCSHGYYKKRPQPSSSTKIAAIFAGSGYTTAAGQPTLQDALSFKGGSNLQDAKNILLRNAAAAYFNAARLSGYPLTTAGVVAGVNAALATNDRNAILAYEAILDGYNNLEGPNC